MVQKKHRTVKYRKSIVKSMDESFVEKYGFDDSYYRFERSVNKMKKEGDSAEILAIKYLKEKKLLSDNYRCNLVIALKTIKIEADIIDYENKIVYETKSRKNGERAKKACRAKWAIFEYDKKGSKYCDFKFYGIVVANYDSGQSVKGICKFDNAKLNTEKLKRDFDEHHKLVEKFKAQKRSKNYDDNGNFIKKG